MHIIELINQNMQIFSRAKILVINLAEFFFTCKVRDKSPLARQAPSPNSDRLRFFFEKSENSARWTVFAGFINFGNLIFYALLDFFAK